MPESESWPPSGGNQTIASSVPDYAGSRNLRSAGLARQNARDTLRATPVSLDDLRGAAETVGRDTGVRLVVLFGSAAREAAGAPRPPEDLDLGVLSDAAPDVVDLTNRFIRSLRVQAVDVTDLRRADPLLLMLAARDGVLLYEREPGDFACFASLAARRYADTRKFRASERDEVRDFVTRAATRR